MAGEKASQQVHDLRSTAIGLISRLPRQLYHSGFNPNRTHLELGGMGHRIVAGACQDVDGHLGETEAVEYRIFDHALD